MAVDVAEPAADDEQAGERQRVAGDDPLDAGQRRVEVAEDRGDRDVEHRVVEHHDEGRYDDDREGQPPRRIGSRRVESVCDRRRARRWCSSRRASFLYPIELGEIERLARQLRRVDRSKTVEDDREVALTQHGLEVARESGRMGNAREEHGDVGRADVRADRARGLRIGDEFGDGAAQPMTRRLRGHRQVDGVGHLLGERAVPSLEGRQLDEERLECRAGIGQRQCATARRRATTRTSLRARPRPAPAWWGSGGTRCRHPRRPGARLPRPGLSARGRRRHLPAAASTRSRLRRASARWGRARGRRPGCWSRIGIHVPHPSETGIDVPTTREAPRTGTRVLPWFSTLGARTPGATPAASTRATPLSIAATTSGCCICPG